MLDTDRFIRSTRVTPPQTTETTASAPIRVQETFHDRPGGDNARGTAVYEVLAQGSGNLAGEVEREADKWRKVLDRLERQACAKERGASRRISGALGKKIFSAGR